METKSPKIYCTVIMHTDSFAQFVWVVFVCVFSHLKCMLNRRPSVKMLSNCVCFSRFFCVHQQIALTRNDISVLFLSVSLSDSLALHPTYIVKGNREKGKKYSKTKIKQEKKSLSKFILQIFISSQFFFWIFTAFAFSNMKLDSVKKKKESAFIHSILSFSFSLTLTHIFASILLHNELSMYANRM